MGHIFGLAKENKSEKLTYYEIIFYETRKKKVRFEGEDEKQVIQRVRDGKFDDNDISQEDCIERFDIHVVEPEPMEINTMDRV
jgi:uncharacterized membrane protein